MNLALKESSCFWQKTPGPSLECLGSWQYANGAQEMSINSWVNGSKVIIPFYAQPQTKRLRPCEPRPLLTHGHQFQHQHRVGIVCAANINTTLLHTLGRHNAGYHIWGNSPGARSVSKTQAGSLLPLEKEASSWVREKTLVWKLT